MISTWLLRRNGARFCRSHLVSSDMAQTFLVYGLTDASHAKVITETLTSRGYSVGDANRLVKPSIQIRIRENTGDLAEVEKVIATYDPQATPMPGGTPSMNLAGYRDGR